MEYKIKIKSLNEKIINYFESKNNIILNSSIEYTAETDVNEFKYILKDLSKNESYNFSVYFYFKTNKIKIFSSEKFLIRDFFNFYFDKEIIDLNEKLIERVSFIFKLWKFIKSSEIDLSQKISLNKNFNFNGWTIKDTLIGNFKINNNIYKGFSRNIFIHAIPDIIFINDEILSFYSMKLNVERTEIFKNKYNILNEKDIEFYNNSIISSLNLTLKLKLSRKIMKIFSNLDENDIIKMDDNKLLEHLDIALISNY